jgi:steroid delta-isomerase-like uncharacterized protein
MREASPRDVARAFVEKFWNERQFELAERLIAADCVTHQLRSGSERTFARGPAAIRAHAQEWLEAFPDLRFDIEQLVAEGDLVATRCRAAGTHLGTWLGVPATGRRVELRMSVTQRIVAGRVHEDWVIVEVLGAFQQLGLVPPTEELLARRGGSV